MIVPVILNLFIAVSEAIVLWRHFRKDGVHIFIYYTTDSNLFAMAASLLYAVCGIAAMAHGTSETGPVAGMLRYMAVIGLTITFLVVVLVLSRYEELGGLKTLLLKDSMLFTHFLCPVVSLVSFLFFEDTSGLGENALWIGMIPTFIYAVLSVIMNICRKWEGPYPFLKVHTNGWKKSILWAVILLSAFIGIAAGLLGLNRCLWK